MIHPSSRRLAALATALLMTGCATSTPSPSTSSPPDPAPTSTPSGTPRASTSAPPTASASTTTAPATPPSDWPTPWTPAPTFTGYLAREYLNWSGYYSGEVETGEVHRYVSVEGRLVVPRLDCAGAGQGTAWSGWVGMGGHGEETDLPQTGITGDCGPVVPAKHPPIDGVTYYGWAMMFGGGEAVDVYDLLLRPGDTVLMRMVAAGDGFDLTLSNETTGEVETRHQACVRTGGGECGRRSVDWIVERPGYSALAPFGQVRLFDNLAVRDDGTRVTPASAPMINVTMAQGVPLATAQPPDAHGDFVVVWHAAGHPGQ